MKSVSIIHLIKPPVNHRVPFEEAEDFHTLIADLVLAPSLLDKSDRQLSVSYGLCIRTVWVAKHKAAKLLQTGQTAYQKDPSKTAA